MLTVRMIPLTLVILKGKKLSTTCILLNDKNVVGRRKCM